MKTWDNNMFIEIRKFILLVHTCSMATRSLTRGSTRVLSALSFPSAYAELARTALKMGTILVL
jgi:hypothetical protein